MNQNSKSKRLTVLMALSFLLGGISFIFSFLQTLRIFKTWMAHFSGPNSAQSDFLALIPSIIFFIILLIFTAIPLLLGYFVTKRENSIFSKVLAGIVCILILFGTIVGIISSVILSKQGIKAQFTS